MSDRQSSPPPPRRGGPMGRGGPGAIGAPVEKAADFRSSAQRLLRRLTPERMRIAAVMLLAVVGITFTVLLPKILGHATDIIFSGFIGSRFPLGATKEQVLQQTQAAGDGTFENVLSKVDFTPGVGIDTHALRMTLLLALAFAVLSSGFQLLQGMLLNGVVQRTIFKLRSEVEDKLNRLPLDYFDTRTRGEVLSRVTNDIDNVQQSLQQTLTRSINSLLTVVGVLVVMFYISPLLAIIGLISVPLSLGVTAAIAKRSQRLFVAQWANTGALNGHVEEAITGHSLVKVFGREKDVEAEFQKRNDALYKSSFGAQFISGTIMPAMFFIGNLNYVILAVVGGLRVAHGAITVGEVQAFIQYSRQFTQPLTELASMSNTVQSGIASVERVFELLDAEEQSTEPTAQTMPARSTGRVAFENVSFAYDADKPLITDLSFVAEPGQTVAIVGPTGAGKTTLVNLIMRFYEVQGGRITLDGTDTSTLTRHQLRSKVGMVLQDTWLFGGTIRDNIAYGRPEATFDEIEAAAQATYVDRFVRTLPNGYDSVIDDEGSNISAGEKQLLTIARAFLADPSLLILDEATSSVDTRTEVLVQHAMAALRSERTSFVIAHRLSTIRDADLILVMDNGNIVEQGTHSSLLAAGGAYFTLYNSQFSSPSI